MSFASTTSQHVDGTRLVILLTSGFLMASSSTAASRRQATIGEMYRWPGGIVPYEIDGSFTTDLQANIYAAITEFNSRTCVKWVPCTSTEKPYVNFVFTKDAASETSSSCNIGPATKKKMALSRTAALKMTNILHEMMHCIGFLHEHSRDDRDRYVRVLLNNVKEGFQTDFAKISQEPNYALLGAFTNSRQPYDYNSIMHYGKAEFSIDRTNKNTIVALSGIEVGRGSTFTDLDIKKIATYYECVGGKSTLPLKSELNFENQDYGFNISDHQAFDSEASSSEAREGENDENEGKREEDTVSIAELDGFAEELSDMSSSNEKSAFETRDKDLKSDQLERTIPRSLEVPLVEENQSQRPEDQVSI